MLLTQYKEIVLQDERDPSLISLTETLSLVDHAKIPDQVNFPQLRKKERMRERERERFI